MKSRSLIAICHAQPQPAAVALWRADDSSLGIRRGSVLLGVGDDVRSLTSLHLQTPSSAKSPKQAPVLPAWAVKRVTYETPHVVSYILKGATSPHSNGRAMRSAAPAFVLLEIVIAIALFSMVAVSMVQALDAIAKTSKAAKSEGQVMRVMESVLAEVVHQPKLKPGGEHFEPGADGVEAQATIEKIKLITRNKSELSKMYRIHVDAWVPDGRAKTFRREMETYVYSPNSPDK